MESTAPVTSRDTWSLTLGLTPRDLTRSIRSGTSSAPSDMVECAWQSAGVHAMIYGILNGLIVSRGVLPGGNGRALDPGRAVVSNGWPMLNGECSVHSCTGSVPAMKYSVTTTSTGQ